ncbi:MAG: UvrD-helicase domain-containing protein [Steroidobacteraceae bacterium]
MTDPSHSAHLLEADRAARIVATDVTQSILLEAPAGSGKTRTLVTRFLALLAVVDRPEGILAMTFTRKAAGEMRSRIIAALRGEIDDSSANAAVLRELAEPVRARDVALGWGLLENPEQLRIETIDSFCYWLATILPLPSQTVGGIEIEDSPSSIYARVAAGFLARAAKDPQLHDAVRLVHECNDNNRERLERSMATLLSRRAQWLPLLLQRAGDFSVDGLNLSLCRLMSQLVADCRKQFGVQVEQQASTVARALARAAVTHAATPETDLDDAATMVQSWHRLANLMLTRKGTLRAVAPRMNNAEQWPNGLRDAWSQLREQLSQRPGAIEALATIQAIPASARFQEGDVALLCAIRELLLGACAELNLHFAATGRHDYTAVTAAAREALVSEGEPTDLALRLGGSFRHLLIDECQDLSPEQLQLIENLVIDWQPGDGRTLFIVGDPAQSIYQFRDADVGLFLRLRTQPIAHLRLRHLQLHCNFRSRPALIEFNNALFAAPQDEGASLGNAGFASEALAVQPPTAAEVTFTQVDGGDVAAQINLLVERVVHLLAAYPDQRIGVLVRKRAEAQQCARALRDRGIAVNSPQSLALDQRQDVLDLLTVARLVLNRHDRVAWLAMLRSPCCALDLRELKAVCDGSKAGDLEPALLDPAIRSSLGAQLSRRIDRLLEVLAAARRDADELGVAAAVERMATRLGLPLWSDGAAGRAMRIFTELLNRHARGVATPDLASLQTDLRTKSVDVAAAAQQATGVTVMTIHAAKGLEFDAVILPRLESTARADNRELLEWFVDYTAPQAVADAVLAPRGEGKNEIADFLRFLDKRRRTAELRRLGYVAATRARESLDLIATESGVSQPPSGSLAAVFASQFGQCKRLPASATSQPAAESPPNLSSLGYLEFNDDAFGEPLPGHTLLPEAADANALVRYDWAGDVARHVGTVIHAELLRWSANRPEDRRLNSSEQYCLMLAAEGVSPAEIGGAVAEVESALNRLLAEPQVRWLLDPGHREAASELSLAGNVDGLIVRGIIDRSFISEFGERWVVDFKTGRHAGGAVEEFVASEMQRYRMQLRRYSRLVGRLGPEPVRAGIYFVHLLHLAEYSPEDLSEGPGAGAVNAR